MSHTGYIAQREGLDGSPVIFGLKTSESAEVMLDHVRSAHARKLPLVRMCRAHGHTLCVAGGGPSLEDTYKKLDGYIVSINASQTWLKDRNILPDACGILDPSPHVADLIDVDKRVRYYVAATCHPSVFDKLDGCAVSLWYPSGTPGSADLVKELDPDSWFTIGGGTTMGVRWLNLGYILGFRRYDLHGLDSSFRGGQTHAYPDRRDGDDEPSFKMDGYATRMNFQGQVADFFLTLKRFLEDDIEPVAIEMFGDGLLQHKWREYRKLYPDSFRC